MPDTNRFLRANRRRLLTLAGLSAGSLAISPMLRARRASAAVATPYYLNCYFPNSDEHRLHYSLSTDGYHFTAYSGNPVMTDTIGTGDRLLRDPHIIRDVADAGRFHLVSTYSWTDRPFVAWDTTSLSTWANGRLVYPSDATMKQTWAPQYEYDAATGRYFVYWTGCINNDWSTADIRYMTTTDFQTWSAPATLFNKPVPVMDASIFTANGRFHMVYRGENGHVYQVTSSGTILGPYDRDDHLVVSQNYEGPFVYQLYGQNTWLMIMDIYGPGGPYAMARSTDAVTWTSVPTSEFSFPSGASDRVRHGSVIPITADEYAQLTGAPSVSPTRFRSYNYPDRYLRHYSFRARLDANPTILADSQFRVVNGLAGTGTVSLESVNFPGYYLRHRNFELWLDPHNGSTLFSSDASFYRRAGLANAAAVSLESYNYAGRYVRHFNNLFFVQPVSTTTDRADATFHQE